MTFVEEAAARRARVPRPAAVIFDLDGTLVDTVGTRIDSWLEAFERFGYPATRDQIAPLIGIDGRRLASEVAHASGRPIDRDRAEEIDKACGEIFGRRNRSPRPLPGVHELGDTLDAAAIPWAIATSSRREQVATSVGALDLRHQPTIVDGSHVERAKPEPDLLLLAARELHTAPDMCWCVGDSTWDMRAAVAARMTPIAVTAGSAVSAETLLEAGAALVVGRLDELRAELD